MNKYKNYLVNLLLIFTFASFSYFLLFIRQSAVSDYLLIRFIDVGQGDCILVTTPKGKHVLIDSGDSQRVVGSLSKYIPQYKRNIDYALLTHPHFDHLGGFLHLIDYYSFDLVIQLPIHHTSNSYSNWLRYLIDSEVEVSSFYQGDILTIEDNLNLRVLWPREERDLSALSLNNSSIVTMLEYYDFKVLLMGDAERYVEGELIISGIDLNASVLKVGHHGSSSSTSEEFLKNVSPKVAVISVGKDNNFGHPSEEVISILEINGIDVLRTDVLGDILILSDGKGYWVPK